MTPAIEHYKKMLPRDEAIAALVADGYSDEDAAETYDAAPPRADAQGRSISLVPFSQIEPKWTDWLWQGRIPRGMVALLVGDEGLGKSALTLSIAANLTRGTLDGDFKGSPSRVAVLTTEDDPARTMWPRIEAAGADKNLIFNLKMKRNGEDSGITFPDDAPAIGRALGEANVRLVIVDPIAAALDPKVNTWKDTDVRSALTPLIVAAEEHDFAVLGLLHTNKRSNSTAREKAMGSAGFQQLPRSAMLLGKNPDDEDGRVLAHFKCNVGRLMPSLDVRLEERTVDIMGRKGSYPHAVIGGESDLSADDIASGRASATAKDAALRWLYGFLSGGPRPSAEVEQAAVAAGHTWRTVERAKTDSAGDIEAARQGSVWVWKLSENTSRVEF